MIAGVVFIKLPDANAPILSKSSPLVVDVTYSRAHLNGQPKQVKSIQLRDLVPKFQIDQVSNATKNASSSKVSSMGTGLVGGNGDQGSSELFSNLTGHAAIASASEKFSGLINYPSYLRRDRIGGVVNVRIPIKVTGECDFNSIDVSASDGRLIDYVRAQALSFCASRPFHGKAIGELQQINFSVAFDLFREAGEKNPDPVIAGNNIFMTIPGGEMHGMIKLGPIQVNPLLIPTGMFIFANPDWIADHMPGAADRAAKPK